MSRKEFLFSMPQLFDSAIEIAKECLEELCDVAERDGTKEEVSLFSIKLGRKVIWYRPKKRTLKRPIDIAKAIRACQSWQAADAARKAYDRCVRDSGKVKAERLFQVAVDFGKHESLFRASDDYNVGFRVRSSMKKGAKLTNEAHQSLRHDYQQDFDELRKKGMGIGKACEKIALRKGVGARTVRDNVQLEKR